MKMRYFFLVLLIALRGQLAGQGILETSNLPIFIVTTPNGQSIPDEPKLEAHLGIIWDSPTGLNHITDPFNGYDGKIGIERRGSSSQSFPKVGYALETIHADGTNQNVPLLGLPEENDWVLHGPYSDKSLLRNALAYTLAGTIMEYAPRVRFCELVVNGDYQGVYLFTEKIKRDKNRVDISSLEPDDTQGDDLTGGYILKFDKYDGAGFDGFFSQYPSIPGGDIQAFFQYHYPKPDDITPLQKSYIQGQINLMEDALKSDDFADPNTGYRRYFDLPSFIQFIFVQEISRNVDGYRLSTYFHKDKNSVDEKWKFGPVWDFNLGFGNADYCYGQSTDGWALDFNDHCPWDHWVIHFWWDRLLEDPTFADELNCQWRAIRTNQWSDVKVLHLVDSMANLLQLPAQRNFTRWPVLGEYVWPNWFVGNTYQEEVAYLRQWITDRLAWLDGELDCLANASTEPLPAEALPVVSPNPFHDSVHFRYSPGSSQPSLLEVFNAQGQMVLRQAVPPAPGQVHFTWQAQVPKGMYAYKISAGGKIIGAGRVVRGK